MTCGLVSPSSVSGVPEPEPPPGRGKPRIQYERTYVLLPPTADYTWAAAVINATWDRNRWTLGGSADDAGVGDLDVRRVIVVNPHWWDEGGAQVLFDWFAEFYPGVELIDVRAIAPAYLEQELAKP